MLAASTRLTFCWVVFVHLGDGQVDLFDAAGLFLRGGGDVAHDVGDMLDAGDDL
ncbi:hypothetical protein XPU_0674, partial [Xanthomonas arboricola pv. pruni str. MAFF 311562]